MKKLYHTPFMECVKLSPKDVLTLSAGTDPLDMFGQINFIRKLKTGEDKSEIDFGEVESIRRRS